MLSQRSTPMLNENDTHWFVLRVKNSSPKRLVELKDKLNEEEIIADTYIPLAFLKVSEEKMDFTPSLVNYIYVRATLTNLRTIKGDKTKYERLYYQMHPVYDEKYNKSTEPLFVTDKKMNDFIQATAVANERVIFLNNPSYAFKPSQGVQITEGQFAGVKGRIKRIKGNRCVVIPIGSEIAVAITGVGRSQMRYLSDEELEQDE